MVVPIYQRPGSTGGSLRQIAGITALNPGPVGSTTFDVPVAELALCPLIPAVGDRIRDDDGVWWVVTAVGAISGDAYPLDCDAE